MSQTITAITKWQRDASALSILLGIAFSASPALAQQEDGGGGCTAISLAIEETAAINGPLHQQLKAALTKSPVGLQNDMWGTIVDRNGIVCAVANTSNAATGAQWLASRVISAQKANTANSLSLTAEAGGAVPGLALSTANLWAATQPGGSLFGLQFSNPVDPAVAYGDNAGTMGRGDDTTAAPYYGAINDPLVGKYIGGINVFGGGLALYAEDGTLVGGLGVSGDTSCADHVVAWITRHELGLDNVPNGVSATGDDNIIFDVVGANNNFRSRSGFGHPTCGFGEEATAEALPDTHPID